MQYLRALMQVGPVRPQGAVSFGGCWFTHVEVLSRNAAPVVVAASDLSDMDRARFAHAPQGTQIMGILNVTPDSFSDGGQHAGVDSALAHARAMVDAGAQIIDVGGESTRPGARAVPIEEEIARTAPVIAAIRAAGMTTPISIDTRSARVADAALRAGATIVNDVSGFTHDPDLIGVCLTHGVPVCVMHAQGDPQTMQNNPAYEHVVLDVYDWLAQRIAMLEAAGIARARITADPGIGFGKTLEHNLALINRISLFHGLGVPILLGASRKRFIGTIARVPDAQSRASGSVGVALAAIAQGVAIIRAHDVGDHAQAIALWRAAMAHPVS